MIREISAAAARRYLVLRQLLAPPRSLPPGPESVLAVMARLGSLQFDPIDVAGRNHDLVLLARIEGYRRQWTDALLYERRELYETYNKGLSLVPTAELPWYRVSWDASRERLDAAFFGEHAELVEELLDRIRRQGPLAVGDLPPRAAIDWSWRPTNQVRAVLEALAISGILGLAGRDGNRRLYDLAERLFPAELLAVRLEQREQRLWKMLSRFRGHGLAGAAGSQELWLGTYRTPAEKRELREALIERGAVVPVRVDGLREVRYVPAEDLPFLESAEAEVRDARPPGGAPEEVAFIAPLDPLVWDRRLLRDLFAFDYLWEVYVPPAKRRWGYYVLPILYGDRFVGRIELRADRRVQVLQVLGVWWEAGFDAGAEPRLAEVTAAALAAHREFVGATSVKLPRGTGSLLPELRRAVGVQSARRRPAAEGRPAAAARG